MLYRFVAVLIVIFWVVMTTLLIRNEVAPDTSRLRDVPLSHVMKLLYLHQQPSDLNILSGARTVGTLRLHPHKSKEGTARLLECSGSLQLSLDQPKKGRLSWDGVLEMTPGFAMQKSQWGVTLHDPGFLRAEITTVAGAKTAHLTLRTREQIIDERDVPLEESGLLALARQFGVGPEIDALVQQAKNQAEQTPPVIRSRQSSLRFHDERTDTYLVTIEHQGQTIIDCHFSLLGQVLEARTILGHTLRPQTLAP
jgi:hypothetical protein